MADDSPKRLIQVLLAFLASPFASHGVGDIMSGNAATGTLKTAVGIVLVLIAFFWDAVSKWAGPKFTATTNRLVSDARWWVAVILVGIMGMSLSRFVEERRLPFSSHPQLQAETASLRLQFGATGRAPQQIEAHNIGSWSWVTPDDYQWTFNIGNSNPNCIRPPSAPPQQPMLLQQNLSVDCLIKSRSWLMMLAFDSPGGFKKVEVDSYGASIPRWETVTIDKRHAVLWFRGDLANTALKITAVSEPSR